MPHAHIIVWMHAASAPQPHNYDEFLSAEIPDVATHPTLHRMVTSRMLHGFCHAGKQCYQQGRCSKHYPKEFSDVTRVDVGSHRIVYRRRAPGAGGNVFARGDHVYNNANVVSYNISNNQITTFIPQSLCRVAPQNSVKNKHYYLINEENSRERLSRSLCNCLRRTSAIPSQSNF